MRQTQVQRLVQRVRVLALLTLICLSSIVGSSAVWRYRSASRLITTFSIAQTHVDVVAIDAHGEYIAAAGSNADKSRPEVYVWHVQQQQPRYTIPSLNCFVTALAISSDGQYLAVATGDGAVTVWDFPTGAHIRTVLQPQPPPPLDQCQPGRFDTIDARVISSVAFRPNAQHLVVSRQSGAIMLIDSASGTIVHELYGHPYPTRPEQSMTVWAVAFSPDGHILASVGADGSAHIWNVQRGRLVQVLQPATSAYDAYAVAFTADGQRLFLMRGFGTIELWAISSAQRLVQATPWPLGSRTWAFNPLSEQLATGGRRDAWDMGRTDTNIYVRTLDDLSDYYTLRGHTGYVSALAFSHDGRRLVSGSTDGTVRLWQVGH